MMSEAIIILLNMRGGCATVGDKVHTLFRVNNRHPRRTETLEARETNEPKIARDARP
jgi:hypothetical protein